MDDREEQTHERHIERDVRKENLEEKKNKGKKIKKVKL